MSKGSNQRPGTGYSDGWDRVFAPTINPMTPNNITPTSVGFVGVPGYELVKSSAIHCADRMALTAEQLLGAFNVQGASAEEMEEWARAMRSAIYEYRKRMGK